MTRSTSRAHDVRVQAALAALDELADSSMCLIAWQRDQRGELVRPSTRAEIRAGLLSGELGPETVTFMAPFAQEIHDDVTDREARERRQAMRLA